MVVRCRSYNALDAGYKLTFSGKEMRDNKWTQGYMSITVASFCWLGGYISFGIRNAPNNFRGNRELMINVQPVSSARCVKSAKFSEPRN